MSCSLVVTGWTTFTLDKFWMFEDKSDIKDFN